MVDNISGSGEMETFSGSLEESQREADSGAADAFSNFLDKDEPSPPRIDPKLLAQDEDFEKEGSTVESAEPEPEASEPEDSVDESLEDAEEAEDETEESGMPVDLSTDSEEDSEQVEVRPEPSSEPSEPSEPEPEASEQEGSVDESLEDAEEAEDETEESGTPVDLRADPEEGSDHVEAGPEHAEPETEASEPEGSVDESLGDDEGQQSDVAESGTSANTQKSFGGNSDRVTRGTEPPVRQQNFGKPARPSDTSQATPEDEEDQVTDFGIPEHKPVTVESTSRSLDRQAEPPGPVGAESESVGSTKPSTEPPEDTEERKDTRAELGTPVDSQANLEDDSAPRDQTPEPSSEPDKPEPSLTESAESSTVPRKNAGEEKDQAAEPFASEPVQANSGSNPERVAKSTEEPLTEHVDVKSTTDDSNRTPDPTHEKAGGHQPQPGLEHASGKIAGYPSASAGESHTDAADTDSKPERGATHLQKTEDKQKNITESSRKGRKERNKPEEIDEAPESMHVHGQLHSIEHQENITKTPGDRVLESQAPATDTSGYQEVCEQILSAVENMYIEDPATGRLDPYRDTIILDLKSGVMDATRIEMSMGADSLDVNIHVAAAESADLLVGRAGDLARRLNSMESRGRKIKVSIVDDREDEESDVEPQSPSRTVGDSGKGQSENDLSR